MIHGLIFDATRKKIIRLKLKGLFVQEFVVQLEMLGWGEEINEFI